MSKNKKIAVPVLGLAAALASMGPYSDTNLPKRSSEPKKVGYEHTGKTEAELEARRIRRQKMKARRNAQKGVYTNKIKYPKKRSH